MKLSKLVEHYIQDNDAFGDNDQSIITEVMSGFNQSLSIIKEHTQESYKQLINEYKESLNEGEKRVIFEDFLKYCQYHNK